MEYKRNKYGLYDIPVRTIEKDFVPLSREAVEAQFAAGAFMMPHVKAIEEGFLHPHDDQDTVIACAEEV